MIIPEGSVDPSGNFEPSIIRVVVGTNNTVRWVNQDLVSYSVASDKDDDPGFFNATSDNDGNTTDQAWLNSRESFEYTFLPRQENSTTTACHIRG